ncbi:MAG: hypothetical protein LBG82_06600 [Clostridiales Family XIII bacterium]|nr:hypothetical protein [Clostridiales Family XIII bacterium]
MYYDRKRKNYRETFTHDGKRHSVTAKTKRELAAKVAIKKRDLEDGKRSISKNMTVRDWSAEWLEAYKESSVSPPTLETYRTALNHINADIGGMMLKDVKPLDCQSILNHMAGKSWSAASKVRQTAKSMFGAAIKNGLMIENPAADISMPKTSRGTHRALTDGERAAFLSACETSPYGLWALLMYHCGLRPGETERIRGKDIDLKAMILHVDGTKTAAAGVPINVAKELMGHASIEMTARIYTHSSKKAFEDAREKIDALGM